MVGIRLPASADTILSAVAADVAGNPLELHRLQRVLMQHSSPDVEDILTGLTHVTSRVHRGTAEAASLRRLVDVALQLDIIALAADALDASCKAVTPASENGNSSSALIDTSPSLSAFSIFVTNLISVDASYVESLLFTVIPRIFLSSNDKAGAAVAKVVGHKLIATTLNTHTRAAPLLSNALCRRYPHPVRPSEEHVAYSRSVLQVARSSFRFGLTQRIIDVVFERLASIEALTSNTDFIVQNESVVGVDPVDSDPELAPEAEKLQAVLLELMRHIRLSHAKDPSAFSNIHFKSILSAHEELIVPVHRPRASPYALILAVSLVSADATISAAERFRQSFHDPTIPERLRAKFLEHSSAIIVRARLIPARSALRWIVQVAMWLNLYVDALEHSPEMACIDVDIHYLFYTACAVLMATLSRRTDVIRGPTASEILARLRLHRILNCSICPMQIIPGDVVENFISTIEKYGRLDLRRIYMEQKQIGGPTRTKNGTRNLLAYSFSCPDLELPLVRKAVNAVVRWDHPKKVRSTQDRGALSQPKKKVRFENIEAPFVSFVTSTSS